MRYRPKIDTFVATQPLLADALARHALFANATRRDFLHRIADIPYGGDALEVTTDAAATSRLALLARPTSPCTTDMTKTSRSLLELGDEMLSALWFSPR